MIYAKDFSYNGASLSSIDPDLVIASFEQTGFKGDATIINRTVNKSIITYDEPFVHDYGVVDNEVFKYELTILYEDGTLLDQRIVRKIISWLFSPTEPHMMTFDRGGCIDNEQMYENLNYLGRFITATFDELYGAYKLAINLTFECTAPYAFTDEYVYPFDSSEGSATVEIDNPGTYLGKIIAPRITIVPGGAGDITIANTNDTSQDAFLIHAKGTSPIRIENFNTMIYDDGDWELWRFDDHVENFNWPIIKDGMNTYQITRNCTGSIAVRFYEALGV